MAAQKKPKRRPFKENIRTQPIVLVGLMGAGKTYIGQKLAQNLHLDFVDADAEIEAAADCTIEEIFSRYGEEAFRDGERRVIARLLKKSALVIATGGGAFLNKETRENISQHAISIWLKADLDTTLRRVSRRDDRPLLKTGDKRQTLERLMKERYPIYEKADLVLGTSDTTVDETVENVVRALDRHLKRLNKV
ncbi:MAG: shikimate kinase [Pseudomonadota bacterium]|nr:shikimate kinase [Pseudomonadota bacterium]